MGAKEGKSFTHSFDLTWLTECHKGDEENSEKRVNSGIVPGPGDKRNTQAYLPSDDKSEPVEQDASNSLVRHDSLEGKPPILVKVTTAKWKLVAQVLDIFPVAKESRTKAHLRTM